MLKRLLKAAALCVALLPLAAPTLGQAQAQAWPAKPIRLIVPYAAGGPTDVIARLVATRAEATLGRAVIVDNRAGAGGTIGVDAALKAPPDGYTFALVAPGPLAGMPNLMKLGYGLGDIQYLSLVARIPSVIVVRSDAGFNSLGDLVKAAKASPGKLNYGSAGPGTTPHIGAELLKMEAGIDLTHVPYRGAAPAITALLGGEVQLAMVDLLPVLQHVAAGKLRVLAVAGPQRAPQLPAVPTTAEAGLPGVVMDTDYGVIAAKGLPADALQKFREAITAAVQAPEFREQLLKQGAIAVSSTPDDYRRQMQAESDKWRAVIAKGRITLD